MSPARPVPPRATPRPARPRARPPRPERPPAHPARADRPRGEPHAPRHRTRRAPPAPRRPARQPAQPDGPGRRRAAAPAGLNGGAREGDLDRADRRAGRRSALLDEQWCIGPKMHGGYLLAVLAQAALDEIADGAPGAGRTTSPRPSPARSCAPPTPGPPTCTSTCCAGAGARRRPGSASTRTTGPVSRRRWCWAPCPPPTPGRGTSRPARSRCPPFAECERRPVETPDGRGGLPLMEVVDTRLAPDSLGFLAGRPTGQGRLSGWVELDTRDAWSPVGLLVALDVLPPASFDLGLVRLVTDDVVDGPRPRGPRAGPAARHPVGRPPRGRADARVVPGVGRLGPDGRAGHPARGGATVIRARVRPTPWCRRRGSGGTRCRGAAPRGSRPTRRAPGTARAAPPSPARSAARSR